MPPPIWNKVTRNYRLTGRVRFVDRQIGFWRPQRFVLLQVEQAFEVAHYSVPHPAGAEHYDYKPAAQWVDANALDLASPALRWIFDFRTQEKVSDETVVPH